jgi:hypothetical protein
MKLADVETARATLAAKLAETESVSTTEKTSLSSQITSLNERLANIEKAKVEAEAKAASLMKAKQIEQVRHSVGINWVPGVDQDFAEENFARVFKNLPTIDPDDATVKEAVSKWVGKNKAIVMDNSGSGSGQSASPARVGNADKDVTKMSDKDLIQHMKERKLL